MHAVDLSLEQATFITAIFIVIVISTNTISIANPIVIVIDSGLTMWVEKTGW